MAIPSFNFGTGDWEIEFWIRMDNFDSIYGTVIGNATPGFSSASIFAMVYGNGFVTPSQRHRLAVGGYNTLNSGPNYEPAGNPLCVSDELPLGVKEHIVINKVGSLVRIWQKGTLKGSGTSTSAWNFEANGLLLGRNGWDGVSSHLSAAIFNLVVRNTPIRTAPFTPPEVPTSGLLRESSWVDVGHPSFDAVCNGGVLLVSNGAAAYRYASDGDGGTSSVAGLIGVSAPISTPTMAEASGLVGRDLECGGLGRIWGTVKKKGPPDIPMARRVRLHRSRDGLLVRETWSNSSGAYEFTAINEQYDYDVIAWDHELQLYSVIANNKRPEVG